ncbi:MAG: hypothetical protein EA409_04015 [Saprospirales bacterium]|nr:MAG: hypothetical protein EA409_04015 [Saprospirales bacterium]
MRSKMVVYGKSLTVILRASFLWSESILPYSGENIIDNPIQIRKFQKKCRSNIHPIEISPYICAPK